MALDSMAKGGLLLFVVVGLVLTAIASEGLAGNRFYPTPIPQDLNLNAIDLNTLFADTIVVDFLDVNRQLIRMDVNIIQDVNVEGNLIVKGDSNFSTVGISNDAWLYGDVQHSDGELLFYFPSDDYASMALVQTADNIDSYLFAYDYALSDWSGLTFQFNDAVNDDFLIMSTTDGYIQISPQYDSGLPSYTEIISDLNVTENTQLQGDLNVWGNTKIAGDTNISKNLIVNTNTIKTDNNRQTIGFGGEPDTNPIPNNATNYGFYDTLNIPNGEVVSIHPQSVFMYAMRIYNDTYSTTVPIFDYYPQDDGVFKSGTNIAKPYIFYTDGYTNGRFAISGTASKVGIGSFVGDPTYDLTFTSANDRSIRVENSGDSTGKDLTLRAGGITYERKDNFAGGDLVLSTGDSQGSPASYVTVMAAGGGSSGHDTIEPTRVAGFSYELADFNVDVAIAGDLNIAGNLDISGVTIGTDSNFENIGVSGRIFGESPVRINGGLDLNGPFQVLQDADTDIRWDIDNQGLLKSTRYLEQTAGANIVLQRARGTSTTPDFLNLNDVMANFNYRPWQGTDGFYSNLAQFSFKANEAHEQDQYGTRFEIRLTPNNTKTIETVLSLDTNVADFQDTRITTTGDVNFESIGAKEVWIEPVTNATTHIGYAPLWGVDVPMISFPDSFDYGIIDSYLFVYSPEGDNGAIMMVDYAEPFTKYLVQTYDNASEKYLFQGTVPLQIEVPTTITSTLDTGALTASSVTVGSSQKIAVDDGSAWMVEWGDDHLYIENNNDKKNMYFDVRDSGLSNLEPVLTLFGENYGIGFGKGSSATGLGAASLGSQTTTSGERGITLGYDYTNSGAFETHFAPNGSLIMKVTQTGVDVNGEVNIRGKTRTTNFENAPNVLTVIGGTGGIDPGEAVAGAGGSIYLRGGIGGTSVDGDGGTGGDITILGGIGGTSGGAEGPDGDVILSGQNIVFGDGTNTSQEIDFDVSGTDGRFRWEGGATPGFRILNGANLYLSEGGSRVTFRGTANTYIEAPGTNILGLYADDNVTVFSNLVVDQNILTTNSFMAPDSNTLTTGDNDNDLTIQDVQEAFDGQVAIIGETSNPAIVLDYNFTNVNHFNTLVYRGYYTGTTTHYVQFGLWNFTTGQWDVYYTEVGGELEHDLHYFPIVRPMEEYLQAGKVNVHIQHKPGAGQSAHDLYIDFMALANI